MQRSTLAACLATVAALVLAAPAQALTSRSFVSAFGSNGANCQRTTPCLTLQRAHDQTIPGGEIDIVDPGAYGTLIITKAISIVNDGVGVAGIIPPVGGAAITINAGASDAISLRGLTIDGQGGSNTNGIIFNSGASLAILDCVVRRNASTSGNTGNGVLFKPNGASKLTISDSVFESNSDDAIQILPSGNGDVKAMLNRIEANGNGNGLWVNSSVKSGSSVDVSVFASVAANNSGTGFAALSSASIPARLMLKQSVSANNGTGLFAYGAQAIIRIGDSIVTNNSLGFAANSGGKVHSYGTNQVDGNGSWDSITSKIPLD